MRATAREAPRVRHRAAPGRYEAAARLQDRIERTNVAVYEKTRGGVLQIERQYKQRRKASEQQRRDVAAKQYQAKECEELDPTVLQRRSSLRARIGAAPRQKEIPEELNFLFDARPLAMKKTVAASAELLKLSAPELALLLAYAPHCAVVDSLMIHDSSQGALLIKCERSKTMQVSALALSADESSQQRVILAGMLPSNGNSKRTGANPVAVMYRNAGKKY